MADDHIRKYLADDARSHPPMPDDFWPEEVLVVGRHLGAELAFAVSKAQMIHLQHPALRALRLSLWQAAHHFTPDGIPVGESTLKGGANG